MLKYLQHKWFINSAVFFGDGRIAGKLGIQIELKSHRRIGFKWYYGFISSSTGAVYLPTDIASRCCWNF